MGLVEIQELLVLVNAVEIAINGKVYSKEQVDKIFPTWNEITSRLQKLQRKNAVDQLYEEKKVESKPSWTPPKEVSEEVSEEVTENEDNETEVSVPQ